LATSAAEIAALSPVVPTNVVVRGLPFQFTIEHGTKLPPFVLVPSTVSMNAALPVLPLFAGTSVAITGTGSGVVGAVMVKGDDKDVVVELDTVTFTAPGKAVSVAVIAAVSCVALTNVVGRGEPFQFTTRPFTKFVPFTISVMPAGLHAGVDGSNIVDSKTDVIVGATIENEIAFDVVPPVAGVETATCADPTAAISAAVIVALSCVALRTAVVRLAPFQVTTEHGRKLLPVTIS
jgi:hypothetical protein